MRRNWMWQDFCVSALQLMLIRAAQLWWFNAKLTLQHKSTVKASFWAASTSMPQGDWDLSLWQTLLSAHLLIGWFLRKGSFCSHFLSFTATIRQLHFSFYGKWAFRSRKFQLKEQGQGWRGVFKMFLILYFHSRLVFGLLASYESFCCFKHCFLYV